MQKRVAMVAILSMGLLASGLAEDPQKQKPLRVFFLAGQSNMVGPGQEGYLKAERPELLKPRDDAFGIQWGHPSGPLGCGLGGRETSYGPELMMSHALGDALDEQIIFIKAAWGGKTLVRDFRPPSAVEKRGGEVGYLYTLMMTRFAKALEHLDKHVPAVATNGYELSGFVWFQGENDSLVGEAAWNEYGENLKDLMHDVRTSLGVPDLPVLIIQINKSMWGDDEPDPETGTYKKGGFFVREAQRKVAEADSRAAWVPTKDLNQGYHYDSASHLVIGERAGEAMLKLLKEPVRDDRGSPAVKAMVKKYVLDKILPPSGKDPDFKSLCRGLFAYFPFDEGKDREIAGAAVQPLTAKWFHVDKNQDVWTEGVAGKALRLRKTNYLEFPGFKEPVDDKGLIGDRTISFWYQTNTKRCFTRIGKGAGRRIGKDGSNWFYSEKANYAGWDITHFDIDGPVAFTASFDNIGARAVLGDPTCGDGIKWTHIVATYDRAKGDMRVWVDGARYPKPPDPNSKRKPKNPPPKDPLEDGGHGIIAASIPLSIDVDLENPNAWASFDELCMWDRVLTDEEIGVLYNNGHGIDMPDDAGAPQQ